MIDLQLDTDEIVAGGTLTGVVELGAGASGCVVRLELSQADASRGSPLPFSKQSLSETQAPGEAVRFTYAIPSWAPPTFSDERISNRWRLAAFCEDAPLDRAEIGITILPALPGTAIADQRSAEDAWRRQADHWASSARRTRPRRGAAGLVGVIAVAVVVAGTSGWRYGPLGGLIGFAACMPILIGTISAVRRQRFRDRDVDIGISVIAPVVESGQSVTVDIDAPNRETVSVALVCRAWRYTDFDGASSCVPHVVYEIVVTVPTPSRAELPIPLDVLPSAMVGPSAVHWTISAAGSDLDSVNNPGVESHLIVLARS